MHSLVERHQKVKGRLEGSRNSAIMLKVLKVIVQKELTQIMPQMQTQFP
jgi:hypothetical protein